MLRSLSILALPLLTACVATAPITQAPIQMNFANPARAQAVTGVDSVIVRSRLRTDETTAELAAVPCRLSGPGYSARFTTPAIVELPVFRNTAPQLALSCSYDGETKSTSINAENISAKERREARQKALEELSEGDRSGVSVLLAIQLGNRGRRGFDEFRYPDRTFTFRR